MCCGSAASTLISSAAGSRRTSAAPSPMGSTPTNGSQWSVANFGAISPYPLGNSVWYEWGARIGYRVSQRTIVDGFILGTFGGVIGTTVHGGVGLRYLF